VVCQQVRWRLNGRSHGRSHAHPTIRQLCDLSGEDESCDWSGELIVWLITFAKLLHPDRRVPITRCAAHLRCLLTVFCINTPDCVCTAWFLQAVERCTGGCPQSTRRPDRHVCITVRPPHPSDKPSSCRFCRHHSINCAGTYMHLIIIPLFAHVIIGRVDFLYLRLPSPRFHRRCPVSRTP
jgi:hypothetical protein